MRDTWEDNVVLHATNLTLAYDSRRSSFSATKLRGTHTDGRCDRQACPVTSGLAVFATRVFGYRHCMRRSPRYVLLDIPSYSFMVAAAFCSSALYLEFSLEYLNSGVVLFQSSSPCVNIGLIARHSRFIRLKLGKVYLNIGRVFLRLGGSFSEIGFDVLNFGVRQLNVIRG